MTPCTLVPEPLGHLGEFGDYAEAIGFRTYLHKAERTLIVTVSRDRYSLEDAFANAFGIRDWQHVTVSVAGALRVRLADQRRTGRVRRGGERSPAPLPDWYELAHLAYDHPTELGLDPERPTYQYLPGRSEGSLNIAEALHLRQPK